MQRIRGMPPDPCASCARAFARMRVCPCTCARAPVRLRVCPCTCAPALARLRVCPCTCVRALARMCARVRCNVYSVVYAKGLYI